MDYFLGVLIVGVSLALLAKEWVVLANHRKQPDELLPYDERTFRRRAMVSILLMFFVAAYANQDLAMKAVSSPLAKAAYLSIYLVIVVIIYIEVVIDFRHGRRVAHQMATILMEQQGEYVNALCQLGQMIDAAEANAAENGDDSRSILNARAEDDSPPPGSDGKA